MLMTEKKHQRSVFKKQKKVFKWTLDLALLWCHRGASNFVYPSGTLLDALIGIFPSLGRPRHFLL